MERANGNLGAVVWDFLYPAVVLALGIAATSAVIIQVGGF